MVMFPRVAGGDDRAGVEVYPSDEGDFARLAGVDDPTLLVLAVGAVRAVPPDAETTTALGQHLTMIGRAPEGAGLELAGLRIWVPEHHPHVQPSRGGPIQDVEQIA